MRGKVLGKLPVHQQQGITPAYAGKRNMRSCSIDRKKDHPRVCGEKCPPLFRGQNTSGSPPRMRGKDLFQHHVRQVARITPAYAGKRIMTTSKDFGKEDHPRVCGEKCIPLYSSLNSMGSPPRMRGKVSTPVSGSKYLRITPAYAGKRSLPASRPAGGKDHPRVCGEKRLAASQLSRSQGSPPRMRGKGLVACLSGWWCGITPAYAGKSAFFVLLPVSSRDHPRVCGEKKESRVII